MGCVSSTLTYRTKEEIERFPLFVLFPIYSAFCGCFWAFLKGCSINPNAPFIYTYFTPPSLILLLFYTRFYVFFPYICNKEI